MDGRNQHRIFGARARIERALGIASLSASGQPLNNLASSPALAKGRAVCHPLAVPASPFRRGRPSWPLVLLAFLTALRLTAVEPTFAEWQAACAKLPTNRALGGRLPPKEQLPLATFDPLSRLLDAFFAQATNGPLAARTNWVGSAPKAGAFLNVAKNWFAPAEIPFEPFVEKLVLPPTAKVHLQGDLHGDIHSLLAVLGRLNQTGVLDGFTVRDPELHVVFLGDYTDRGMFGTEVLYTLLRLRLANPERVHLVRGNHEDLSLIARYGFLAEGRGKYGRAFDAAKILRAYDFLPCALYLGSGTNFLQLCHGGMEPGFNPAPLLNSPGTNAYHLLGPLRQAAFLRDHPQWLGTDRDSAAVAREQFRDFVPEAPTLPTVIGFMWNDFTVFRDEPAFAHNPDRAFVYGQPAVAYLLRQAGGAGAQVHGVIRAHQHSGAPNPMMRRLAAGNGAFRHWQENATVANQVAEVPALAGSIETAVERPLPKGSVWTLNVTPDSVYGQACGFDFATAITLKLAPAFADWRLRVEPVAVPKLAGK